MADTSPFRLRGLKGLWWEPEEYLAWPPLLAEAGFDFFMLCYTFCPATGLRWRQPFESSEERVIRRLAAECAGRGIQLCLAVHPSIAGHAWAPGQAAVSIHPTVGPAWFRDYWRERRPNAAPAWDEPIRLGDEADVEVLLRKLRQAGDWGVQAFALCLDDIEPGESLGPFRTLAEAHLSLLERLREGLRAAGARQRLLFVPTYYWSAGARAHAEYARGVAASLPPEVDLFWTGEVVRSHAITAAQAREAAALYGRQPVVWLNYSSNDSFRFAPQLPPAPLPDPDLGPWVAGLMANVGRQSRLARWDALVVGRYLRDPARFDHGEAVAWAAEKVAGPEAAGLLLRFAEAWKAYPDPRRLVSDLAEGGRPRVETLADQAAAATATCQEVIACLDGVLADLGLLAELAAGARRFGLLSQALAVCRVALARGREAAARARATVEAELCRVDGQTGCDARAVLEALDRGVLG